MKKLELWYPLQSIYVSQKFGEHGVDYSKIGIQGHNGWDFIALDGTPVYASHEGTVTFTGEDGAGGLLIAIRTNDKYEYQGVEVYFKSIYCHLKKGSFKVKAGDVVLVGTKLAEADNTGWSTGDHLHFGLKPVYKGEKDWEWFNLEQSNGYFGAIDPAPYWNSYSAKDKDKVIDNLTQQIGILSKVRDLLIKLLGI